MDWFSQQQGLLDAQAPVPTGTGLLGNKKGNLIHGIPLRSKLFPGEEQYFRNNPHVAGMAAEDNQIVMNPYSRLSKGELDAVMQNEAARVHMRTGTVAPPRFALSPEQENAFKSYSNDPIDRASTIAARILSNDPSALAPTAEQLEYVNQLRRAMQAR
jgi:hypothetical protein